VKGRAAATRASRTEASRSIEQKRRLILLLSGSNNNKPIESPPLATFELVYYHRLIEEAIDIESERHRLKEPELHFVSGIDNATKLRILQYWNPVDSTDKSPIPELTVHHKRL
jgi:hypothetical protein